jgi:hypothetical protein
MIQNPKPQRVQRNRAKQQPLMITGKLVSSPKVMAPPQQQIIKVAPKSGFAPVAKTTKRRPYFRVNTYGKDGLKINAQDFMTRIAFTTTDLTGQVKATVLLNPTSPLFSNTRLECYGKIYEKFRFSKVTIHAEPASSTSKDGSYLMSYDLDVNDVPPDTSTGVNSDFTIKEFFGNPNTVDCVIWDSSSLECKLAEDKQFLFCSTGNANSNSIGATDPKTVYQGKVYLVSDVAVSATTNINFWIEYEILLINPGLDASWYQSVIGVSGAWTNSIASTAGVQTVNGFGLLETAMGTALVYNDTDLGTLTTNTGLTARGFNLSAGVYSIYVGLTLNSVSTLYLSNTDNSASFYVTLPNQSSALPGSNVVPIGDGIPYTNAGVQTSVAVWAKVTLPIDGFVGLYLKSSAAVAMYTGYGTIRIWKMPSTHFV